MYFTIQSTRTLKACCVLFRLSAPVQQWTGRRTAFMPLRAWFRVFCICPRAVPSRRAATREPRNAPFRKSRSCRLSPRQSLKLDSDQERSVAFMPDASAPLLSVQHLKKYFPIHRGVLGRVAAYVKAVDDISFDVDRGETFGLVGESGCGKTTAGRAILRLLEPDAGAIRFEGADLLSLGKQELRRKRRDMQIIFQDPYASLNPRMTIRSIVGEPFVIHNIAKGPDRDARVAELLKTVGLDPSVMRRYPHEFSGGQRQRIGIARELALKPKLIVADEPVY